MNFAEEKLVIIEKFLGFLALSICSHVSHLMIFSHVRTCKWILHSEKAFCCKYQTHKQRFHKKKKESARKRTLKLHAKICKKIASPFRQIFYALTFFLFATRSNSRSCKKTEPKIWDEKHFSLLKDWRILALFFPKQIQNICRKVKSIKGYPIVRQTHGRDRIVCQAHPRLLHTLTARKLIFESTLNALQTEDGVNDDSDQYFDFPRPKQKWVSVWNLPRTIESRRL